MPLTDSEKKRRKKERDKARTGRSIYIGDQTEKWSQLRQFLGVSHADLARILLDCYEKHGEKRRESCIDLPKGPVDLSAINLSPVVATPSHTPHVLHHAPTLQTPVFASTSTPSTSTLHDRHIADLERAGETSSSSSGIPYEKNKHQELEQGLVSSDIAEEESPDNPYDVTIPYDWSGSEEEEGDPDDLYDPKASHPKKMPPSIKVEDLPVADDIFGGLESSSEGEEQDNEDEEPTFFRADDRYIPRRHICDGDSIADIKCSIATDQCLLDLARTTISKCLKCLEDVEPSMGKPIGTASYVVWKCCNGHIAHVWCSQPTIKKIRCGDFLLAGSVLFSGNNFLKIQHFTQAMHLPCISDSTFYRIQKHYLQPVICRYWEQVQTETLLKFQNKNVVVCGDARMDSPGWNAKYCTYGILEHETHNILAVSIVDKREVDLKSTNMEKKGLKMCLSELKTKMEPVNASIEELATDGHLGIKAMMKTDEYKHIYHSNDIWHSSKAMSKRLHKSAESKDKKDVLAWIPEVVKHFWFAATECKGDKKAFTNIWRGTVHHVVGKHRWALGRCLHGDLEDPPKQPYLKKGSPSHIALTSAVLHHSVTSNTSYFVRNRHTGMNETFNNLILAYAAKRFAYSYMGYKVRCLLAAIDHQKNLERPYMKDKKGEQIYARSYCKRTEQWSAKPVKEKKDYSYIVELQQMAVDLHLAARERIAAHVDTPEGHPKTIKRHIAKSDPPPTKDLVLLKKSRFEKKD